MVPSESCCYEQAWPSEPAMGIRLLKKVSVKVEKMPKTKRAVSFERSNDVNMMSLEPLVIMSTRYQLEPVASQLS